MMDESGAVDGVYVSLLLPSSLLSTLATTSTPSSPASITTDRSTVAHCTASHARLTHAASRALTCSTSNLHATSGSDTRDEMAR